MGFGIRFPPPKTIRGRLGVAFGMCLFGLFWILLSGFSVFPKVHTSGRIIAFEESQNGSHIVFIFSDTSGQSHRVCTSWAERPLVHHVGDQVEIAYAPHHADAAQIESNSEGLRAFRSISGVCGFVFLLTGVLCLFAAKKKW